MVVSIRRMKMIRAFCLVLICLFFASTANAASLCYQQAGGTTLSQNPLILSAGGQLYCTLDAAQAYTNPIYLDSCNRVGLLPMGGDVDVRALSVCDKLDCSGDSVTITSSTVNFVVTFTPSFYVRLRNNTGTNLVGVLLSCIP